MTTTSRILGWLAIAAGLIVIAMATSGCETRRAADLGDDREIDQLEALCWDLDIHWNETEGWSTHAKWAIGQHSVRLTNQATFDEAVHATLVEIRRMQQGQ